jgi:hypothetical protein
MTLKCCYWLLILKLHHFLLYLNYSRGDGGGPLLDTDGVQVGITSFSSFKNGPGCNDNTIPDVFTDVSGVQNFIQLLLQASCPTPAPAPSPTLKPSSPTLKPSSPTTADGGSIGEEPEDRSGGGCFSGSSTVQVLHQGTVPMADLSIGDEVLTGANQYEPIYGFGHHQESKLSDFIQIQTDASTLVLTKNHLVFVSGHVNSAVRSDQVRVGDTVSTGVVKKIATVKEKGLYMPLTRSGTIVVNGKTCAWVF